MKGTMVMPFRRLYSSQAGNAALEIAVILPLVFTLVFSLLDMSRLFIVQSILQTSASAVALTFEAGQMTAGQVKTQTFGVSEQIASGWIDNNALTVSQQISEGDPQSDSYLEFTYDGRGEIVPLLSFFAEDFYRIKIRHPVPIEGA